MKNTSDSKQNISSGASAICTTDGLGLPSTPSVPMRKKVYVGMSGGVDSSVSALLLKQQDYDVTGVFIKVWQPDNTDCGWKDERRDAMRVAAVLDIPFLTLDFSEQYKREVVDYMIEEYRLGRTPNPDVMCNRHVKFGSFLQKALADGVDYVATGHYAQNIFVENQTTAINERSTTENSANKDTRKSGHYEMKEGIDGNKDQSYFLWTLTQDDLKHVLFPIGHLEKPEVRRLAEKAGLPVFDKKDSQGVCFIGHLDMKAFLKEYIETRSGEVLDIDGKVIGTHDGAALYTIGERHGFTFNSNSTTSEAHFVIAKDIQKNTITVAPKSSFETSNMTVKPSLCIFLKNESFVLPIDTYLNRPISARIRYRQEKQACVVTSAISHTVSGGLSYKVTFANPQKGMAEGQSVVLYYGNTCLGGGILRFI